MGKNSRRDNPVVLFFMQEIRYQKTPGSLAKKKGKIVQGMAHGQCHPERSGTSISGEQADNPELAQGALAKGPDDAIEVACPHYDL